MDIGIGDYVFVDRKNSLWYNKKGKVLNIKNEVATLFIKNFSINFKLSELKKKKKS